MGDSCHGHDGAPSVSMLRSGLGAGAAGGGWRIGGRGTRLSVVTTCPPPTSKTSVINKTELLRGIQGHNFLRVIII